MDRLKKAILDGKIFQNGYISTPGYQRPFADGDTSWIYILVRLAVNGLFWIARFSRINILVSLTDNGYKKKQAHDSLFIHLFSVNKPYTTYIFFKTYT